MEHSWKSIDVSIAKCLARLANQFLISLKNIFCWTITVNLINFITLNIRKRGIILNNKYMFSVDHSCIPGRYGRRIWNGNFQKENSVCNVFWAHLKRAHQILVNIHHRRRVIEFSTVVRCREHGDQLLIAKELVSVLHDLMCSNDQIHFQPTHHF